MQEQKFGKNRLFAGFVLVCMLVVWMLSASFVVTHAQHNCTGENCTVCSEIHVCTAVLLRIGEAGGATFAAQAIILFFVLLSVACVPFFAERRTSLVALEIRLNL